MLELPMAPSGYHQLPTLALELADDLAYLHRDTLSDPGSLTRACQPSTVEFRRTLAISCGLGCRDACDSTRRDNATDN